MSTFKLFTLLALLVLNGCTMMSHMEELSTLGDVAREKDNQNNAVKLVDDYYDALVAAIVSKQMDQFPSQVDIRRKFGDPMVIKTIQVNGHLQQEWMYRHSLIKEAKDKVYLYFDDQGQLFKYEQEKIQW